MEPKPGTQYATANNAGCPACRDFGEPDLLEGLDIHLIGRIAITTLHGVCLECNREIHFSSRDKQLARLVERTLAARRVRGE